MNQRKLLAAATKVIAVKPHVSHMVLAYVLYALKIKTSDSYEVAKVAEWMGSDDEDIEYAINTLDQGSMVYRWINTEYKKL